MFKKAINFVFATFASANINEKYSTELSAADAPLTDDDYTGMFNTFKNQFADSPVTIDESRFEIFKAKVDRIREHNADDSNTWTMGLNKYSAMTWDEVSEFFNLEDNRENAEQNCSATGRATPESNNAAPDSFDWRTKGGVSPVKDQGSCGSCWTFSTVGCLESAHLIQYGILATYSEQQLVDCAGDFDNYGCNGGLPSHAFEYVKYTGGIASEDAYPYYAEDRTCTVKSSDFILSVGGGAFNITEGDENALKTAVYQQPVSVAFEVVDGFSDYTSGVYTSSTCGNTTSDVNHAVLAVGYGHDKDSNMDYWIVKNSWSATWGDEGYFKIERGVNMCGIAMCNSYPQSVSEIGNYGFTQ